MPWVVDTNVPIVANGTPSAPATAEPSKECRRASVAFLLDLMTSDRLLLDLEGAIQAEYRTYLKPSGQPGVGDRFYLEVLNSHPDRVERVSLALDASGEYADLPRPLIAAGFDPADRKFAALAKRCAVPVANSTDRHWAQHRAILEANGVSVHFVCAASRDP